MRGVFVPIPSLPFTLSQKRLDDWIIHHELFPKRSCPEENPDIMPPVSVPILTVFPLRVNQFVNRNESPILHVRLSYVIAPVDERDVSHIFVATIPERDEILAFAVESHPERDVIRFEK